MGVGAGDRAGLPTVWASMPCPFPQRVVSVWQAVPPHCRVVVTDRLVPRESSKAGRLAEMLVTCEPAESIERTS